MKALGVLLWIAVVGCGDEGGVEVCDNGFDDDADALVDCGDTDCAGAACVEVCVDQWDNDADGLIDCADMDCDGGCVEHCTDGRDNDGDNKVDCADDQCASIVPESCGDSVDNDCDGTLDCADPDCDGACPEDCTDARDNDADGAIDCADPECDGISVCPENCLDGRDNDTDLQTDCLDADCAAACDQDEDGYDVLEGGGTDCDDMDADVNPDADEVCNGGIDDDCNGLADDDDMTNLVFSTAQPVYKDADYDGYGDLLVGAACVTVPPGNSFVGGDCDDSDLNRHPGATEVCVSPDDDCDGLNNDADPSLDLSTATVWYEDVDGDGFGDPDTSVTECTAPDDFVDNDDDCHLFDPDIGPETEWWPDGDGDGWSAGGVSVFSCVAPIGYGELGDCDDTNPDVHAGAIGAWPSLVAAWQADGTTADSTGTQPDGVILNNVIYEDGVYGECFQFDGINDSVEIATTWEGPVTLSFWMAPGFLPQGDAGIVATAVTELADDTFQVALIDPDQVLLDSNLTDVDIGVTAAEVWLHVAVAYDGVDLHTWADGVPVAIEPWLAAEPPEIQLLRLGTDRTSVDDFAGRIDDVLLFNRALTDLEVAALHDGTASCMVL